MSLLRCLSDTACLLAAATFSAYAQPTITAIVNGASFEPVVAPGSLVAIYGKRLAQSTQAAPSLTNLLYDKALPPSGTVVFDDSSFADSFGSYLSIPYAPYLSSRSTGFKLYIDGTLIDSQKVTYPLPTPAPPVASVSLQDITGRRTSGPTESGFLPLGRIR